MTINKRDLLYGVIIILLLLFNFMTINKMNNMNDKFDKYEQTISALNDTVSKRIDKGMTYYTQKTPEIYLSDLLKSEYFKTLTEEQKRYYQELNKIKGLLSATEAQLRKQGQIIDQIKEGQNPGIVSELNDSIAFKLGTELTFKEQDTTKKLQWDAKVTLDKNINFIMNYDYNVNIRTSYIRNKDKSITVEYKIDDPELQVNKMYNYIIPPEQRKTKFGRWIDKNKKVFNIIGGGVLFLGGGYLGYQIAK